MKTQTSFSENGDDIEDSSDPSVTTDPNASSTLDEARDEVKEIRDLAKKGTKRVRMWRLVVTVALLVTSCAVTLTTFRLLRKEEEDKFKTAVSKLLKRRRPVRRNVNREIPTQLFFLQFDQFSKTVLDAAVVQHQNRLESYSSLADIMSSVAYMNNETWPMYVSELFCQTYDVEYGNEEFHSSASTLYILGLPFLASNTSATMPLNNPKLKL